MRIFLIFLIGLCLLSSCQDFDKRKYVTKHANPRDTTTNYPFISGDIFRQFSDHIVDDTHIPFDPTLVKERDIVFVKTKFLRRFCKYMHPRIRHPYILITHNGDEEIPGEYDFLLDDEKIVMWFGMNATRVHPKLVGMPIGFGSAAMAQKVAELRERPVKKERLLYFNCSNTHPEREEASKYFSLQPFCTVESRRPLDEYIEEVMRSKFNVSPRGNGIDCHRVWESIFAGTIPVLKSTPLDPLYEGLPVLIVREWSEVTETLLEEKYQQIAIQEYNLEKLYADYWLTLIESYSNRHFSAEALRKNSKTPARITLPLTSWHALCENNL